jgi:type IV pilus assembly protein PilM
MNFGKTLRDTLTIEFDKAFGLDIGDRSVEIIELDKFFRFSVVTYGRAELPVGIVKNGKIIDQNVLAEKLKKLLKEVKPKRVSTNKVIVSLPESQVFVECFEVDSKLKFGALSRAIVDKVSLLSPINIDKTYWDYIEKPSVDKSKKLIIFVSVPKDVANSYVRFCNSIGLEVVSLCLESLSLARTILKSSPKQSLIMDIGSGSTNLSFFDSNDKLNMSVTIPVAGEQMTQAIADQLKIEGLEAEALKVKFGFKDGPDNNVRPIILPVMEDLLRETKQAVDYYEETFKQKLEDIYVIGGSVLLPGIIEIIKTNLKRNISPAESAHNINLKLLTGKNNFFPLFVNVIGLGMIGASGQFRDINLLKKMPKAEVNSVSKLDLFKMGYLSPVNTVRRILNNKFILITMVILIGVIFMILLEQTKDFDASDVSIIVPTATVIRPTATSSPATSTLPLMSTSTKTQLNVR